MTVPVKYERYDLSRPIVGSRRDWILGGARIGAGVPVTLLGLSFGNAVWHNPEMLSYAGLFSGLAAVALLSGGFVGAALGAFAPTVFDRLRGRVSLWLLVPAQGLVGAVGGVSALGLALAMVRPFLGPPTGPLAPALMQCAGVGALAGLLWWLPFTVATVLGRRWPVSPVISVIVALAAWAML